MKIVNITEDQIAFDNGDTITHFHERDCCEKNFADFCYLEQETGIKDYDFQGIQFEDAEEYGFRFGDDNRMFFVPCYSQQNGYYSNSVTIRYNGKDIFIAIAEVCE